MKLKLLLNKFKIKAIKSSKELWKEIVITKKNNNTFQKIISIIKMKKYNVTNQK